MSDEATQGKTQGKRLLPFHETICGSLNLARVVGIQTDRLKQGAVLEALDLIMRTEIPAKALPSVLATCTETKSLLELAASHTPGEINQMVMQELMNRADDVMGNLEGRLAAKQEAATEKT